MKERGRILDIFPQGIIDFCYAPDFGEMLAGFAEFG